MSNRIQVTLPDIGDFKDVEVIEILVAPGETIEEGASLITLESDKASMEIPAPKAGVVAELHIKLGDKLNQGDPILSLSVAGETKAEPEKPTEPVSAPAPAAATQPAPAPAPAAASSLQEIRLPDIGDFKDVEVIEILVSPGDQLEEGRSLITLESDKASMEIPSSMAGTLQELKVKLGDKLNQGDLIATVLTSAAPTPVPAETKALAAAQSQLQSEPSTPETKTPERAVGEKEKRRPPVMPTPADLASVAKGRKAHAGPGVRRFARELGVDLGRVTGTGPKGRILRDDVQNYVKQTLARGVEAPATQAAAGPFQLPAMPEIDFSKFGEIKTRPLGRIKKLSGAHLHRCWLSVPHVTQHDEADISELEAFRVSLKAEADKRGVKLTLFPFLMKAVASALQAMPDFNASLAADGENLILKQYINIGVAVDTPNGLVVPVVRDVERKSLFELAQELMALSAKARDGKLSPTDMQGGTFSISSLGGIGGRFFTPIVNAPEVAILGVSRSQMQPVWDGKAFVPKLMLPMSLSYDHRVIDGAQGARFTTHLAKLLADIRRLLL